MRGPEAATLALGLLHFLVLWAQVMHRAQATFQLPPFLQALSEQALDRNHDGRPNRVYTLPSAVPNVPNIRRFTPREKHLKTHKLMRRLRNDFDTFWMSVERPKDADEETVKVASVDPTLEKAVERLNFTLRGPDGVAREMEESVSKLISAWLLQRSNCHVHYVWDDLGVLYWPRWVRRGFCKAGDKQSFLAEDGLTSSASVSSSCSWPPGMLCVPAESRRIKILSWQCRHNKAFNNWGRGYVRVGQKPLAAKSRQKRSSSQLQKTDDLHRNASTQADEPEEINETENWSSKPFKERRKSLRMRCKWKKIRYPVTDDCFCSC